MESEPVLLKDFNRVGAKKTPLNLFSVEGFNFDFFELEKNNDLENEASLMVYTRKTPQTDLFIYDQKDGRLISKLKMDFCASLVLKTRSGEIVFFGLPPNIQNGKPVSIQAPSTPYTEVWIYNPRLNTVRAMHTIDYQVLDAKELISGDFLIYSLDGFFVVYDGTWKETKRQRIQDNKNMVVDSSYPHFASMILHLFTVFEKDPGVIYYVYRPYTLLITCLCSWNIETNENKKLEYFCFHTSSALRFEKNQVLLLSHNKEPGSIRRLNEGFISSMIWNPLENRLNPVRELNIPHEFHKVSNEYYMTMEQEGVYMCCVWNAVCLKYPVYYLYNPKTDRFDRVGKNVESSAVFRSDPQKNRLSSLSSDGRFCVYDTKKK